MFGLFKKKSVNFGTLIKERDKIVILLSDDLVSSLDILASFDSWSNKFKEIIVKTDDYFLRFWQSLLKEDNLLFKSKLETQDKKKAIVLDFGKNKADVRKFKSSLILSDEEEFCNFTFSTWEYPLSSFAKLFSLNLQNKKIAEKPKNSEVSQDLVLLDLAFDRKAKQLQESHNIVTTSGDPQLQEKNFLEIYELACKAKKILCFNEKRKKMWEFLGFQPSLIEKKQDYAQIL